MKEATLHISSRLKALLPPLTAEEKKQLKANIKADGIVTDAILFWNDGKQNIVVDGMHRWEIVRGTEILYRPEEKKFGSYEEAEIWILNHQLGRRNLLDPAAIRKIRGELYNRLKSNRGGDQKSGKSKGQIDPLIGNAAEEIGAKAGVSASTVKRDGARVEALGKLSRAAKVIAKKATDAEVKSLAKLDQCCQDKVARAVRTGQAESVKLAMKLTGMKPPPSKPKTGKGRNGEPPKKYDRSYWYKQWEQAIGPVVRLVDKIATEVGERHDPHQEAAQKMLNSATEEMMKWMGMKK